MQGHVAVEDGPCVELLVAHWAVRADTLLAFGVPVSRDADLAEGVAAGDGHRIFETVQADGAG